MTQAENRAAELNFSWVEDLLLAGCRGPRTDRDLAWLSRNGIQALVRLAHEEETGLTASDIERHSMHDFYEPVADWNAPAQVQLDRIIAFVTTSIGRNHPVAVSCGAGRGRTGTVLACYLVGKGLGAQLAIEQLIAVRPCSNEILQVPGQRDAIVEFDRRLHTHPSQG